MARLKMTRTRLLTEIRKLDLVGRGENLSAFSTQEMENYLEMLQNKSTKQDPDAVANELIDRLTEYTEALAAEREYAKTVDSSDSRCQISETERNVTDTKGRLKDALIWLVKTVK